ncbi:MAG: hypothetical protein HW386_1112 [Gammaproteobacteria bacterium]|nr:hypothetical protein [Gammaproteobacteria bacterium]
MRTITHVVKIMFLTTTGLICAAGVIAQESSGKPDLNGVWLAFASEPRFVRDAPSPLSENGEKLVNAFSAKYGDKYVEPGGYCVPPGMPSTMTALVGYPVEIIQSKDRVTMLAEMEMQVRRIYLDGRKVPEDYPATRIGYSIGSWNGDVLVIDTALLNESLLRQAPRSENTRIQERIYLIKRTKVTARPVPFITLQPISDDVLVEEITTTDATLYKEPQKITVYYQKIKDDATLEYDCAVDLWNQALEAAAGGGE